MTRKADPGTEQADCVELKWEGTAKVQRFDLDHASLVVGERPWHHHWPKGVPKTIDYPDTKASRLLGRSARTQPEQTAIVFDGKRLTFRRLDTAADTFAFEAPGHKDANAFPSDYGVATSFTYPGTVPTLVFSSPRIVHGLMGVGRGDKAT